MSGSTQLSCPGCKGLRNDNSRLRQEILKLREALRPIDILPAEWGLTHGERVVFNMLLKNSKCRREACLEALLIDSGTANNRAIDTMISKIRKKLQPYMIEIQTIHGLGYQLTSENRKRAQKQIESEV